MVDTDLVRITVPLAAALVDTFLSHIDDFESFNRRYKVTWFD